MPTPTTSRKPPSRVVTLPDQIDNFKCQDKINDFSEIKKELCPHGYEFKSDSDKAVFFKLEESKTGSLVVSESISIDASLHVSLYSQGSPIPLPPWFRQGNDKCILLKKSVLENFPPYIKNLL